MNPGETSWWRYSDSHPLHQNVQRVLGLVKTFNDSIRNFISNPCVETADRLEGSYKEYIEIPREDWKHPQDYTESSMYKWFNQVIILKEQFDDFFENKFKNLIKKYRQGYKINYRSISFKQWQTNLYILNRKKFEALFNASPYRYSLVRFLDQKTNPIVGEGFCYGIAHYCVYSALKHRTIVVKDIALVSKDEIQTIEKYQMDQYLPNLKKRRKYIVAPKSLSSKTPQEASIMVAKKLKEKLKLGSASSRFGLELGFSPNGTLIDGGHALGIAKTRDHYFFIDANCGVFRFPVNEIDKFCEFIAWFLDKTKYCHYFGWFDIRNFPGLERDYPTLTLPPKLKLTGKRLSLSLKKRKQEKSSRVLNNCKDGFNMLHTAASVMLPDSCSKLAVAVSNVISAPFSMARAILFSKKRKCQDNNNSREKRTRHVTT